MTMSLNPPLRACWMKRGIQREVPAYTGTHQNLHWIGAYDYQSDCVHCQLVPRKNSDSFLQFLEYLVWECYPKESLVLILDNASYHHTPSVYAFFDLVSDHLLPLFLPPYCPELNLIERFWQHLKNLASANTLFPSVNHLISSVEMILHSQNDLEHPVRFLLSKDFQ